MVRYFNDLIDYSVEILNQNENWVYRQRLYFNNYIRVLLNIAKTKFQ